MVLLSRTRNSVSSELRRKVKNVMKKVDEVSRLSGVSKRTLQYYDDEGLLPAKRSEENYRLYDETAMERLWEILWYKEMGFQLKEIKEILSVPKEERKQYFERKIKRIEEKINDLEVQRRLIQKLETCEILLALEMKEGGQTYKEYMKRMIEQQKNLE